MQASVRFLADQLAGIRLGTQSAGIVDSVRVVSAGRSTPIRHLAKLARQGDRITITPFDRADVPAIVKALVDAKWDAYAQSPTTVCVGIPPVSGEQRIALAKHVKKLGEEAKIAVRGVRQDARKQIAARGKGSERAVQEATDAAVAEIDRLVAAKIADLNA